MHPNENSRGKRSWRWAAGAGLILFVLIQLFPAAWSSDTAYDPVISRDQAEAKALNVAANRFGISAGQVRRVVLVHLSNSAAVGYFSKERLIRQYEKQWESEYPTDVYRADLEQANGGGTLTLLLKLDTGQLVGWRDADVDRQARQAAGQTTESPKQAAARAMAYASFWGVDTADWEWNGQPPNAAGRVVFGSRKAALGEAHLKLSVQVPPAYRVTSSAFPAWHGGAVTYGIEVPKTFTQYVEHQSRLAGRLNALGFVVPQLILLLLAIVYAATRSQYTTFRRGVGLSVLFFVFYTVFTFNMIPGFRAQVVEEGLPAGDPMARGLMIANLIVLAGMALFTYFAAVAGDGLWRSMGRPLWPRWRDPDFGRQVVASMKTGYLLAFILLGAQSVILLGLERGIGMFQASDATQSTYNMTYPWLLLLLAWCAGISEEIQSRFFGIALFRSWLLGGAKKLLGREPGKRTAQALTAAAMLPPGLFWAFGHVGYAVYPAYSRVIELILMGMLFGWFLVRFGLMAVIFAHVILDSILMGVQMAFDGLPGDLPAALLGLIMPAAAACFLWWLHAQRVGPRLRPS